MCTRFIKLRRQEGRNSHVTQDHIGVCHMKTNMNKKAREHMNFRVTQEMQRYRRTKEPFRALRMTRAITVLHSPPHIAGLGVRSTRMSMF